MALREIDSGLVRVEPIDESEIGTDAITWLKRQGRDGMVLLAHADDGVIWGRVENQQLRLPPRAVHEQAELRNETLQMARLFDDAQELFIWRTDERTWQGRELIDGEGETRNYFEEAQVLWGTHVEAASGHFARVAEGQQGLRHAVPLQDLKEDTDWGDDHPLRLKVRHYLAEDEEGWLRIAMSRLVDLGEE